MFSLEHLERLKSPKQNGTFCKTEALLRCVFIYDVRYIVSIGATRVPVNTSKTEKFSVSVVRQGPNLILPLQIPPAINHR